MAKRIGPEAKIIALFTALPEDSKRIVFDVIKSQQQPRKAATKKPRKNTGDVTEPHKTSGVAVGGSDENPSPRAGDAAVASAGGD